MQSVDESYEFVSLEGESGMAGGDSRRAPAHTHTQAPAPAHAHAPAPATANEQEHESIFEQYPPQHLRELAEENGIHYFEDGHFYTEVILRF